MTTATLSKNEILEALSQLEAADICDLVAKVARKNQAQIEKQAARMQRQAEREYDRTEDIDAYDEAVGEIDEFQSDNKQWETLAEGIESLKRDL